MKKSGVLKYILVVVAAVVVHCLCGPPSIPLSFNRAVVLPRWITYCVNSGTEGLAPHT